MVSWFAGKYLDPSSKTDVTGTNKDPYRSKITCELWKDSRAQASAVVVETARIPRRSRAREDMEEEKPPTHPYKL